LKNRFNNELRLNLSLGETNFNASIVNKFKTTFLNILKRRNFNRKDPAIILEPKKGGFYVYYSGVYGFLPQSQF
jgi:ribosomal protein S1